MVQRIMFTKPFKGKELDTILESVKKLGFDGLDFAVRPGYPVNPENFEVELPRAASRARDAGLAIELITPSAAVEADDATERLWASAAQIGARFLKVGYWLFEPGQDYSRQMDGIRRSMDGIARLAEEYGVRAAVHQHSGTFYGSTCCSVMHMVRGFDPAHVCVYMDPGHLSVDGEIPPLAFGIIGEYLGVIALKNPGYVSTPEGDAVRWERDWNCKLAQGLVDWPEVFRLAAASGFDGPLSFHSEWDLPLETVLEWTADDLAYADRCLKEAGLSA